MSAVRSSSRAAIKNGWKNRR